MPALPALPDVEPGELPTLESLIIALRLPDDRAVTHFVGGETAALQRIKMYFWERDPVAQLQIHPQSVAR